jgi:hypothetical protein
MNFKKAIAERKESISSVNLIGGGVDPKWRKHFENKSLIDLYEAKKLQGLKLGTRDWDGNKISNLLITIGKETVAVPLSRGYGEDFNAEDLINGQFYIRNKRKDTDADDAEPTGPEYLSFGKPAGFSFDDVEDLMEEEVAEKQD